MVDLKESILEIAKDAVEGYVRECKYSDIQKINDDYLKEKKACFVCLKKEGNLRGCIGTIKPECENLAEEIAKNAVSAAVNDFRFTPVIEEELELIKYSVDVLSPMEKTTLDELDPKKYGVLVKGYFKSGVLLPDLEGVSTVEEQISIAKRKAGLSDDAEVQIYRFTVERFE